MKKPGFIVALALGCAAALGLITFVGCGNGGERTVTSSGDPEADQRAEMLVDSEDRSDDGKKKEGATLYERLGGNAGISAIVDDMTDRTIADPRVNFERKNVRINWVGKKYDAWEPTPENVSRLKQHLVEFLTLATGGPSEYTGGDLRTVHERMKITNNEFDAMVGNIKTSMDKLGVGKAEMRDLLAIVETTRKQIVEKK